LEKNSHRIGQPSIQPCAQPTRSATLPELMHGASGIGKVIPAFIAPFAVPPGR
jgi:hypothetical protein